ncbi:hypothetical protein AVEN_238046-1 [Araneus ventricosus]|uniref:Uncharacterized protein n=1 Tax=Araneus ventricosus TaxID=182803 RepID=A0A4Y2H210_ARAVE|nr:hypothetical protein AVEN_238046-1 [Araneus ventricosus]
MLWKAFYACAIAIETPLSALSGQKLTLSSSRTFSCNAQPPQLRSLEDSNRQEPFSVLSPVAVIAADGLLRLQQGLALLSAGSNRGNRRRSVHCEYSPIV